MTAGRIAIAAIYVIFGAVACSRGGSDEDFASIGGISVSGAWTRPTVGAAETGAAYLTIANRGATDDALIGASSPASSSVELHEMSMSGGVMRMRAVSRVVIPAGSSASFTPGGNHIMLIGLKAPLKAGSQISLALEFEHAPAMTVRADVQ